MSPEQIVALVQKYEKRLEMYEPKRFGSDMFLRSGVPGAIEAAGHLRWMCQEVPKLVDAGKIEKAHRWLGFLQGALWTLRETTIADLKRDNR